MFHLFGKKKEQPAPPPAQETGSHYKAFAAQFETEERSILAVTGAGGFSAPKDEQSGLYRVNIPLTAWLDEDEPETIHREATELVALAERPVVAVMRQRLPGNFILKLTARRSLEGDRLMLTGLPSPGFDPDLKAILDEQKKPVTREDEALGTFTLSHTMNWFQADIEWQDETVLLAFGQEEDPHSCFRTARTLLDDAPIWAERLQSFLVEQLLDRANAPSPETEEAEEISAEQLLDYLALETILVCADGRFEFWYNDCGLFMGSPVHITGSLADGLSEARVEE